MKTPICSIPHFERLCKSFSKNFLKHITNESFKNTFKESLGIFYYGDYESYQGKFFDSLDNIKKSFNRNQHKTCIGFIVEDRFYVNYNMYDGGKDVKIKVSYTVEDENCKRVKNNNFKNKFIVFRVYMKVENHPKKRLYRWKVKMDWIKDDII
jgi:hypothetical protein